MKRFAFITSLLLAWFSAAVVFAQRADQITPVRGTSASGVITDMSPTEILINVRGSDQKFEINAIKRVTFAEDPPELARARDNVLDGQLENGLAELKRIDASTIMRDYVKQDLDFYTAYCEAKLALTGGGDKDAASQAMLTFVQGAPKSFHFFEAAQLLGDLAVASEKYAEAVKYYGAIAKRAPWPEYQLRAAVLEARAVEAQGNYPDAIAKYDAVIGNTVDSAEANRQKNFARIGKATALAESGKVDEGLAIVEEIIQKSDAQDTELFGRAYNAHGRCYLKANRVKDAILAYLHVDVLFFQNPEVHAEALHHLAKLWPMDNKSDRAVSARGLLTERYAGSVWAKRN